MLKLPEILMPITAPSDLATHPSRSQPYYDPGLAELIKSAEEMLHKEQETLWKIKSLFTQLRGDPVWAPVGEFHDAYDDWLLGDFKSTVWQSSTNGRDYTDGPVSNGNGERRQDTRDALGQNHRAPPHGITSGAQSNDEAPPIKGGSGTDQSAKAGEDTNGTPGPSDHVMKDLPPADEVASTGAEDDESQPQSHRMTTRAQANRSSHTPFGSRSGSPSSSILPIHPMFQFPASAISDENCGLPQHLADESRACLLQYVSKQEEVVRQCREMLENLKRAREMRNNVLRWCKAEGHVGEMSDGEDWYDKEEWGLEADLVKGKDEEDDDDRVGKKTRGRGRKE
jgi:RXT2-like, N-terminal